MELSELMDILVQDTETLNVYINKKNFSSRGRPCVDSAFITLCRVVNQRSLDFLAPKFIDRDIEQCDYPKKDVYVLPFSGGKVSLALALKYKNMGKNVHLFYVENSGVSRYGCDDSKDEVIQLSKMLDMPLYIDRVAYYYFEHSLMKHLLILGRALRFAVTNGYRPEILYGTFEMAHLSNNDFNKSGMSCIEVISAYSEVMRKYCYGARVVMPFPSYSVVWDELMSHRRYIPLIKCSGFVERRILYIAQIDHGIINEEDSSLYMKYIKELKNKLESSPGDINKLWNKYFFYRIEKSKHYQELMKLS